MQERRLSSDWTWWHKRKALFWSALLLLGSAWLTWRFEIPLQLALFVFLPGALMPGAVGFLLARRFVDEVEIIGDALRVRRGGVEIKVALADVERVSARNVSGAPIELELREPSRFGRTISFLPPFRSWRWTLKPGNSMVDDLRARIQKARA